MSRLQFNSISELHKGNYRWNIKVRVLRKWGIGNADDEDTMLGFNLLLLDDKDFRLHAFAANEVGPTFKNVFQEGKIYTIANFTVKEYQEKDKNLPIEANQQMMFTSYTKVKKLEDEHSTFSNNAFEFYNIDDLEKLATQDKYLTDVIGVVEQVQPIRRFVSQKGERKVYLNFVLTNGRSKVNVTLWEKYAETFVRCLASDLEQPVIVIISSAKVGYYSGALQVATWFNNSSVYVNYDHHTVTAMRKKFSEAFLTNYEICTQTIIDDKLFTVAEILSVEEKYIGKKIMAELILKKFKTNSKWIINECTSCQSEVEENGKLSNCLTCKRELLYTDMKFSISAICYDDSGSLGVVLKDRDVRRLTRKYAYEVYQDHKKDTFPPTLKTVQNVEVTVLLEVSEDNVEDGSNVFHCVEVAIGHQNNSKSEMQQNVSMTEVPPQSEEATTSSYEGVHLTDLNIITPPTVTKRRAKLKKKFPNFQLLSQDSD